MPLTAKIFLSILSLVTRHGIINHTQQPKRGKHGMEESRFSGKQYIQSREVGNLKPSFHELHPPFALFLVVGTGRIDVAHGLVSASVVSRIVAVNSSHVKEGGSGQMRQ
ncbi:hypothetical protein AVEN_236139-1 [Araneus ventricosus]|uniref:Uncharacterized protein n=1 Tax=Araneus ventricosus TaxID=182803 RepID=A0A4Y2HUJ2_ARAVE|nr:hypothetical protein AVEN_236139-1 [Araneus ventricosus]